MLRFTEVRPAMGDILNLNNIPQNRSAAGEARIYTYTHTAKIQAHNRGRRGGAPSGWVRTVDKKM
jgi:hypothetical protein